MTLLPQDFLEKFGAEARDKWKAICKIAGVGSVPFTHTGGICLGKLTPEQENEIRKILGLKKAKAEPKPEQAEAVITEEETNTGDNN